MSGLALMLLLNPTAFAQKGQEKADVELAKDAKVSPTAFTYQGQLKDADGPVNGSFDFQFVLYSAQTGGEQLGVSQMEDVSLTNGMFSFKLDFGRAAVEAKESWLEIGVRQSGSAEAYTVLFPRQKLTPTPYAIFAQHEHWSLIGVPVGFAERLDNDAVPFDAETKPKSGSEAIEPAEPATPAQVGGWTDDGPVVRLTTSTDRVGIGTTTPNHSLSIAGGPVWTSNGWKGALELENASAIAWQANAAGQRFGLGHTGGGFFVFRTASNPGTAASPALYDFMINDVGNIGIGTTNPQNTLHVGPGSSSILASRVNAVIASNRSDAGIAIAQNSGVNVLLQASGAGGYIGTTTNHPLILRTNDLDTIIVNSFATTIRAADLLLGHPSRRGAPGRAIVDFGGELVVNFGRDWPSTTIGSDLGVIGRTTTQVLQITGGSDLSENFDVRGSEPMSRDAASADVQPGLVVAIDSENPGKLVVSHQAYDRRVAGIISGAGGVKPGMVMGQAGSIADGAHPVALTGRVYCLVDASYGTIEPGDLLTTSATPGHAMKVTDHAMAQGAILGKAMTSLKEGKGLVLVLVTLQ